MNLRFLISEADKRIVLPGLKNFVSTFVSIPPASQVSTDRKSPLGVEARSQFAALREVVDQFGEKNGQPLFVWPQARLCDFIVLDNPIEHLSTAHLMQRSKVPFVLCDTEAMAPKLVVRFRQPFSAKSFMPSQRRERKTTDMQDNVFRKLGLPVVLLNSQLDLQPQITVALTKDQALQDQTKLLRFGSHAKSFISVAIKKLRTLIVKVASLTTPKRKIPE